MSPKALRVLVLASCFLCIMAANANAKTERTVSVVGTATTQVVPDMVVWKISTTSSNKKLSVAKAESDRKIKAVLNTARSLGVAHQDIQTGHMAVQRIYDHGKFTSQRGLRSYRVTREVTITQREISRFDEILSKLIQASDMEVRYTLESSILTSIRDETRLKAVKAAKKKAKAMAGALGAGLGKVLTLTEDSYRGGYNQPITNTVNWYENGNDYGRAKSIPQEPSTMAPGTIDVKVSVATVFELR